MVETFHPLPAAPVLTALNHKNFFVYHSKSVKVSCHSKTRAPRFILFLIFLWRLSCIELLILFFISKSKVNNATKIPSRKLPLCIGVFTSLSKNLALINMISIIFENIWWFRNFRDLRFGLWNDLSIIKTLLQ